jgi:glutamine synthetase
VNNQIIPAALSYQKSLIDSASGLKGLVGEKEFSKLGSTQLELIREISERVAFIKKAAEDMRMERKKANTLDSAKKQANAYCEKVKPYFDKIRYEVDHLEYIVDDNTWPLPKYREMLYLR